MFSFTGKLIDVRTGDFNSLTFESTKWDAGLQREVESSLNIAINKDHLYLVDEYRKAKGSTISIPVRPGITKNKTLWFATAGNGRYVVNQPIAPKVA